MHAVVGADSYLAEQALEALLAEWVGSERADSVQVLRGDEATWGRVLEAARTGSLFSSRRAVVVASPEQYGTARLFMVFAEAGPVQYSVFYNMEAALQWVKE